jgi:hypothetical protein
LLKNERPLYHAIGHIDVGAGVSVLIDNLLDKGYKNLSLLEFSPIAIQTVKNRLKNHLGHVTFYNEGWASLVVLINLKSTPSN